MEMDPLLAYRRYRVCDKHFEDICRIPGESRLKRDSLPTLHLPPGFFVFKLYSYTKFDLNRFSEKF